MSEQFEVNVPDGQHLAVARDANGAMRGLLFDDKTNRLVGHADLYPVGDNASRAAGRVDPAPARQLSPAERELLNQLIELGVYLTSEGVKWVAPRIKTWFVGTVLPAMKTTVKKLQDKSTPPEEAELRRITITDETVVASVTGAELAAVEPEVTMTSTEFLQRFSALRAAKAFEDEQWRLLSAARIDDGEGQIEAKEASGELASYQFAHLVQDILNTNPALFDDGTVEELIRIMRSRPDDEDGLALSV